MENKSEDTYDTTITDSLFTEKKTEETSTTKDESNVNDDYKNTNKITRKNKNNDIIETSKRQQRNSDNTNTTNINDPNTMKNTNTNTNKNLKPNSTNENTTNQQISQNYRNSVFLRFIPNNISQDTVIKEMKLQFGDISYVEPLRRNVKYSTTIVYFDKNKDAENALRIGTIMLGGNSISIEHRRTNSNRYTTSNNNISEYNKKNNSFQRNIKDNKKYITSNNNNNIKNEKQTKNNFRNSESVEVK